MPRWESGAGARPSALRSETQGEEGGGGQGAAGLRAGDGAAGPSAADAEGERCERWHREGGGPVRKKNKKYSQRREGGGVNI